MGLLDNDYCAVTLSDGTQRFLPVAPGTTCGQRPTLAQAQAQFNSLLLPAFVPHGYHLESKGCLISWDTVVTVDEGDWAEGGDVSNQTTTNGFDSSYTFSRAGQDFAGHSFLTTPAPILTARVDQTKPRLLGNNYVFAPQMAFNTSLFSRLPAFSIHASKTTIYPGGLWSDPNDNTLQSRGWSHMSGSTRIPSNDSRTYKKAVEQAFYVAAKNAATRIGSSNPSYQKLLDWCGPFDDFHGEHILIDTEDACKEYAYDWYLILKSLGNVESFSINHEVYTTRDNGVNGYVQWYQQVGWIAKWIIYYARQDGDTTMKCCFTDWGNIAQIRVQDWDMLASQWKPDDGLSNVPAYMHYSLVSEPYGGGSANAPLGENSTIAQICKAGNGIPGLQSYMKHTWDDQTFFVESSPGAKALDNNGNLIYRTDQRNVTLYNQDTVIVPTDGKECAEQLYIFAARLVTNWFFRSGGKHLALSTDRQTGWESLQLSSAFRLDGEWPGDFPGVSIDQTNARPLNKDLTEFHATLMYMESDYIRGWMVTQEVTAMGADADPLSKTRGSAEIYTKAWQRASQLNWIFDTPYQLLQPRHWIFQQGGTGPSNPDEQFYRKPFLQGGYAKNYQGQPALFFYGCYVCQDVNQHTDMIIWGDTGTAQTPAYTIRLDGRKTFIDWWFLPSQFINLNPAQIFVQFVDMTGTKQTWDMDYRTAKITNHPIPPVAA